MGRASRWLRNLFSKSNHHHNDTDNHHSHTGTKPKWITTILKSCKDNRAAAGYSVVASGRSERTGRIARDEDRSASKSSDGYAKIAFDRSHAEAVAAASAAAAEAAVVAAHAAVEVVRLQRIRWIDSDPPRRAAVVIQSVFRGYLARRALRALRALVRLQALVRGRIVRKQTARRMHALIMVQARARGIRAPAVPASSHSSSKTSNSCILDPPSPGNSEYHTQWPNSGYGYGFEQAAKIKRSSSKVIRSLSDHTKLHSGRGSSNRFDEKKVDKIMEVDSANSLLSHSDPYGTVPVPYSSEDLYLQYCSEIDQHSFYTADDSPRFVHTGSSRSISARRGGPSAQANVDFSESYLGAYPHHPNYMAYTKSSRAKMRSLSAPKQRTQLERSASLKSCSTHDYASRRPSTSRAS